MNDVDVQLDGVVELGMEAMRNAFSMCLGRAVQTLSLWLDVSQGIGNAEVRHRDTDWRLATSPLQGLATNLTEFLMAH